MTLLTRIGDWVDSHMAETWPSYVFFAGLILAGCCCGGCLTYIFTWLFL